jgi:hypothetical protein
MDDDIIISQCKYVLNPLQRFKMEDYKLCATRYQFGVELTKECNSLNVNATLYRHLVGSLTQLTHQ